MTAISELLTDNIGSWTEAVKPKASTGRGGGSNTELYGVKKLRGLILDLAMRGLLGPQNPGDSPAQQLLAEAEAERELSISEGRAKKQKVLSSVTEEEKTFCLPRGWSWVRFGNLFTLEYGDNLPEKKRSGTGEYPVYGSNGVVGSHNSYCVQGRCIVVGRKGSAGALNLSATQYCWVTDVAYSLVPPSCLSVDFVYWLLHTLRLDSLGKGIKPGLSRSDANQLVFGLPPVSEQHRIVSKINELMALCDKLEAQQTDAIEAHKTLVTTVLDALTKATEKESFDTAWARIAEYFDILFTTEWSMDKLKQTILQLAIQGALGPQSSSDEPAHNLLERVASEKSEHTPTGKGKKRDSNRSSVYDHYPFVLPKGWEWTTLGTLSPEIHYGYTASAKAEAAGTRLLRITDIQNDKVDWRTVPGCDIDDEKASKYLLKNGDLLIARTGGTIGKSYLVSDIAVDAVFASYLIRVKKVPIVLAEFLKIYLGSEFYWRQLYASAAGTGQPNVNASSLKTLKVPIAPIEEQARIVAKVDELLAICDQLKVAVHEVQQTQLLLADAITEQAVA